MEKFKELSAKHLEFIKQQHVYFVGTAGPEGLVNVSPKGMDSLRVIAPNEVVWLNLTGSGNESAAHVRENGRMTIMFCSFDRQPLILRLYGTAQVIHPRDADWQKILGLFPSHPGARQIFRLRTSLVVTSCGYAVPQLELVSERPTLTKWAENKGPIGIEEYWATRNTVSLDGKDTGLLQTEP